MGVGVGKIGWKPSEISIGFGSMFQNCYPRASFVCGDDQMMNMVT